MTEQTTTTPRQERTGPGGDPTASPFDDDADLGGTVYVSNGMFNERLPLGGMTVAEVRRRLGDRLDLDPDAIASIDNQAVGDETTTRVVAGQVLSFIRLFGEKGTRRERRAA